MNDIEARVGIFNTYISLWQNMAPQTDFTIEIGQNTSVSPQRCDCIEYSDSDAFIPRNKNKMFKVYFFSLTVRFLNLIRLYWHKLKTLNYITKLIMFSHNCVVTRNYFTRKTSSCSRVLRDLFFQNVFCMIGQQRRVIQTDQSQRYVTFICIHSTSFGVIAGCPFLAP